LQLTKSTTKRVVEATELRLSGSDNALTWARTQVKLRQNYKETTGENIPLPDGQKTLNPPVQVSDESDVGEDEPSYEY